MQEKNTFMELFSQFSKHLRLKNIFLIQLMLSANIFQVFEIHFKLITHFRRKHPVFKIVEVVYF